MTPTRTPDVHNRLGTGSVVRDLVVLLARIGLGIFMVVHAKLEYDFAGALLAVDGGWTAQ